MKESVLCINSTVAAQKADTQRGEISPFHEWGFQPGAGDLVLCNGRSRFEIVYRSKIGGLDLKILALAIRQLIAGWRNLYLVTQPDLIQALPLLKASFPSLRVVTWVWTAAEVRKWKKGLRACGHVFCLTEPALEEMRALGLGDRASLQYLGADPGHYQAADDSPDLDACFIGRTKRDLDMIQQAMERRPFRVVTTEICGASLAGRFPDRVRLVRPASHFGMIQETVAKSALAWIPLFRGELEPAGYTNLVDALLSGRSVVIARQSTIPSKVLSLPGVFLYEAQDNDSFLHATDQALGRMKETGFSEFIRQQASLLLDGVALRRAIEEQFGARALKEQPAHA